MTFRIKDVLSIDATVIIGLLILLTFQSISSSFIENESSNFMNNWYESQNQYYTTLGLLDDWDCIEDKTAWEIEFESLVTPNPYNYDYVSKEMEGDIKNNCSKWLVENAVQERYLLELDRWGYDFGYLQQVDEDGYVYIIDYADFTPGLVAEESDYFRDLVTGPFYVNMANLIMLIPFTVSAIIASCNVFRKNVETNKASRLSVAFMAAGFGFLFAGLTIILIGFYEVYTPFLDHWSWSYGH